MLDMEEKRILFIAAHTDDVELACGATVAKCIRLGADVYYVAMTSTDNHAQLEKEAANSMKVFGIPEENYRFFHQPNRYFPNARQEILTEIEIMRDKIKPQIVFTPSLNDIHQDHYQTAMETMRAFKYGTDIVLGYNISWNIISSPFNAKFFVEVSKEDLKQKLTAIACYKSQLFRPYMNEKKLTAQLVNNGLIANFSYAESFEIYRMVWMNG